MSPFILALLASMAGPAAAASGYLPLAHGRLYYEQTGSGPTLVLVGGGANLDLEQWRETVRAVPGHRIVLFDPIGSGKSDPPTAPHSPAQDLAALLDALDVDRAVVGGLSLGGGLALEFALRYPDRVRGLVLAAPLLRGFAPSAEMRRRIDGFNAAAQAGPQAFAEALLADPHFVPAPARPEARVAFRDGVRRNFRPLEQDLFAYLEAPVLRLPDLDAPTLLLVGELDHPDVHRRVRFLAEGIRGARVVTLPAAGHVPPLENPAALARALNDFLASTPATLPRRAFTVKPTTFASDDGVRLAATYYAPDSPGPGALLLHMCADSVDDTSWRGVARRLAAAGVHALTLDFRGYGQSEGRTPAFAGMESFMAYVRTQLALDVEAGLAFLRTRGAVMADRLAVGGASCGLPLAIEAASRHPSVRALALLSGPLDKAAQDRLAGLASVPVLVVASEGDSRSFEAARRVFSSAPHGASTALWFKGETHGTAILEREPGLERVVVAWLRRWLQP